jgi:hypothetical protein
MFLFLETGLYLKERMFHGDRERRLEIKIDYKKL